MTTIATHHIQTFRDNVMHLSQQKISRLRPFVDVDMVGPGETHKFEQLGTAEFVENTSRFGDSPHDDIEHARRVVSMRDFEWGRIVDETDLQRMLVDPTSDYAMAASKGAARKYDDLVIEAATGTANIESDGTASTASLAAANQVAVDYVPSGAFVNSGMTLDKLKRAREILSGFEADDEELFLAITESEMQDLLREDEVVNHDYNTEKVLVNGVLTRFMGFNIVKTERLSKNTSTDVTTCFAWARSGIKLAICKDVTVHFDPKRSDKKFNPYLMLKIFAAATRMEESRVVQILADRSP